ncbi:MAG: HPr family phosphocarrier protein [Bacteriovorax sp.]|nr:HPr family phosphocarrier protein [Bacteriovorax sp.]
MQITVKVLNDEGLHARPAGILVKLANNFSSEIELSVDGDSANAKSIMSIMGLGLTKDTVVTVSAVGDDAEAALKEISALFNNKFNL